MRGSALAIHRVPGASRSSVKKVYSLMPRCYRVSLCRDCNNRKLDSPPTAFYLAEELERLQPLLEVQHRLFEFTLDWDRWMSDREAYLLDLGAEPAAISAALGDEDDHRYVGPGRTCEDGNSMSTPVVIRLNVAELLKALEKPALDESDKPEGYGR